MSIYLYILSSQNCCAQAGELILFVICKLNLLLLNGEGAMDSRWTKIEFANQFNSVYCTCVDGEMNTTLASIQTKGQDGFLLA